MIHHTFHRTGTLTPLLITGMLLLVSLLLPAPAQGELPQDRFDIRPVDETLRDGRRDGFEPHIITGPGLNGQGEWYYMDSPSGLLSPGISLTRRPGNLWISKDHGMTWEWKEKRNTITDNLPPGIGGSGDTHTAISRNGGIFHTDLYLASASVDYSGDGGNNWYLNPAASQYVLDDRQWLRIGKALDGIGEETLYFSFNQLFPLGLVMVKTTILTDGPADNYAWRPCNQGLPITSDVSARDPFCVDRTTGTIYIANYASGARNLEVWRSTDGGESFTRHVVTQFGGRAEVQNIFTVIDTDMDGNVYITYCSRDHIWLAVSTDGAESWAIHQVTDSAVTSVKVLPWIAAGDGGRVGMAWYEAEEGTEGVPDQQLDSWWDLRAAISFNAVDDEPDFRIITVHRDVHFGGIQTTGTGGGSDRDLGDFLSVAVDANGRLLIAYGMDGDDGPDARLSYPMYAGQVDGPFLREDTGPVVNPVVAVDGSRVRIGLEDIADLSGFGISNVTIFWGDGSDPEVMEFDGSPPAHAVHRYTRGGRYTIQVRATNAIGMSTTTEQQIRIGDDDGFRIADRPGWVIIGSPLLILIVVLLVLFMRNRGGQGYPGRMMSRQDGMTQGSGPDGGMENGGYESGQAVDVEWETGVDSGMDSVMEADPDDADGPDRENGPKT